MPITDFLDNVPPNPEGFKPYRPPPPSAAYQPPVVYPPSGNGPLDQPAGQFSPIPNNIFGWFMLMLGL
jgi:hypothetical protein